LLIKKFVSAIKRGNKRTNGPHSLPLQVHIVLVKSVHWRSLGINKKNHVSLKIKFLSKTYLKVQ